MRLHSEELGAITASYQRLMSGFRSRPLQSKVYISLLQLINIRLDLSSLRRRVVEADREICSCSTRERLLMDIDKLTDMCKSSIDEILHVRECERSETDVCGPYM
jgi:hypothetical protein